MCAQTLAAVFLFTAARDTARWVGPEVEVGFGVLGMPFCGLAALGARAAGGGPRAALACCGGGGICVGLSARQVCASSMQPSDETGAIGASDGGLGAGDGASDGDFGDGDGASDGDLGAGGASDGITPR